MRWMWMRMRGGIWVRVLREGGGVILGGVGGGGSLMRCPSFSRGGTGKACEIGSHFIRFDHVVAYVGA